MRNRFIVLLPEDGGGQHLCIWPTLYQRLVDLISSDWPV
jgi:hypothetical protein